jgi:hypothetical protein
MEQKKILLILTWVLTIFVKLAYILHELYENHKAYFWGFSWHNHDGKSPQVSALLDLGRTWLWLV